MATLTPSAKQQFFDANGNPLAGGKLYTYAAGTTTPLATYTDAGGGTPNANPVILNSRGEANIWLGSAVYKFKLTTSADSEIWTVDNIASYNYDVLAALAASGGSSLVGFIQSGTGATARTVQDKLRDVVSVKDFGAIGDNTTNDTTALNNAFSQDNTALPSGTYKTTTGGISISGKVVGEPKALLSSPTVTAWDFGITGSNAILRDVNLSGVGAQTLSDQAISLDNVVLDNAKIENTTSTSDGIGISMNRTAPTNRRIANSTVSAKGYALLIQKAVDGGKGLNVVGNNLKSTDASGIVTIDTPTLDYTNIAITGNVMESSATGTKSVSLFGVDGPQNVAFVGNVMEGGTRQMAAEGSVKTFTMVGNAGKSAKENAFSIWGDPYGLQSHPVVAVNSVEQKSGVSGQAGAYQRPWIMSQTVSSITRSGSTATVTTGSPHPLKTGDTVVISGAVQTEYNGSFVVTVPTDQLSNKNVFTYTVSGTPATPATGTITYNRAVLSITRSGSTATATFATPHGFITGQIVGISGADQAEYNTANGPALQPIFVTSPTTFTYTVSGTPASPATGTIVVASEPGLPRGGQLIGNRLKDFTTGLQLGENSTTELNNSRLLQVAGFNVIENPTTVVSGSSNIIIGENVALSNKAAPTTLYQSDRDGGICGKIYSDKKPTNIISKTSGRMPAVLRGFNFPADSIAAAATSTVNMSLVTLPDLCFGRMIARIASGGKTLNRSQVYISADILWDGSTLTVANGIRKNVGNFGAGGFLYFDQSGGVLRASFYSTDAVIVYANLDFTGEWVVL